MNDWKLFLNDPNNHRLQCKSIKFVKVIASDHLREFKK